MHNSSKFRNGGLFLNDDIFSSSAWTGDKKKNKGDDEINQLSKYQKRYK